MIKKINLNKANENGYTVFSSMCRKKYIDVIKYMLNDVRIDINKANWDGYTPFDIVTQYCDIHIFKYFLLSKRKVIWILKNYFPCKRNDFKMNII